MGHSRSLTLWGLILIQGVAGYLADRNFRSLPQLAETPGSPDADTLGHVSIVVPVRNEETSLPALLTSLSRLRGARFDVTVVDDGSSDRTAEEAERAGARVVRISGPPPGWTGKTFACHVGWATTEGEWILFTDADTIHGPDSLRYTLSEAYRCDAGLVSLLPQQRCETLWERLLLPYAYALYFVGAQRPNETGRGPVANGQYMLFRRGDYNRFGGHAAVRDSIVEDIDLARVAQQNGVRVVLRRAERHTAVRMYSDLPSLWAGFGKNSFRFVRASPGRGLLTVIAAVAFSASFPAAILAGSRPQRLSLLLLPAISLAPWMHRFGVPRRYALLHPLAASVFQLLALDSIRRTLIPGQTVWKGRRY